MKRAIVGIGLLAVATPCLADQPRLRPHEIARLTAGPLTALNVGAPRTDRWLLPDIAPQYDQAPPPRLRIRGKKVKLRLPI
jgi:hypothetical protein